MNIRVFEGPFDNERILHDTRMPVAPRAGDTLTLRWPGRNEARYEVTAIDYLIDVRDSISPVEELTGVRVQVRAL